MHKSKNLRDLMLLTMFVSIIIMFGFIPFLGFISIGPFTLTTIHIPVILGILVLKPKYSIFLGLLWGVISLSVSWMRANTPFDIAFQNPLNSVLPRFVFGAVAIGIAFLMRYLSKYLWGKIAAIMVIVATICAVGFTAIPLFAQLPWVVGAINRPYLVSAIVVGVCLIFLGVAVFLALRRKRDDRIFAAAMTFLFATLMHTALVFICIYFFGSNLREAFGDDFTSFMYGIFGALGVFEAGLAVLVGVPLFIAISAMTANDNDEKEDSLQNKSG